METNELIALLRSLGRDDTSRFLGWITEDVKKNPELEASCRRFVDYLGAGSVLSAPTPPGPPAS